MASLSLTAGGILHGMEPRKLAANGHLLYDLKGTRKQRETWLEENREAIEAYNELVAHHGVFSTGLRGF